MKRLIRRYLGIDKTIKELRSELESTQKTLYAVAILMRIDPKPLFEMAINSRELSNYTQRLAKRGIIKLKEEAKTPGDKFVVKQMEKEHDKIADIGKEDLKEKHWNKK